MIDFKFVDLDNNRCAVYALTANGLSILNEKMPDEIDRIHDGKGRHGWIIDAVLKPKLRMNLNWDIDAR